MATLRTVKYKTHPTAPSVGDMLVWDGSEWVLLTGAYGTLSTPAGSPPTTTWDCNTGLNKKLAHSSDFTLKLNNVSNGMIGDFVLEVGTVIPAPSMTLEAYTDAGQTSITIKGNGVLTDLPRGVLHICWVYDGDRLTYNMARYAD